MFNHVIADGPLPKYLSTDHDPLFRFHRWLANLRVLDIEEIKSVPYTPVFHPFVERLIGTIRREYLDQILFWNSRDLKRKLEEFMIYYNGSRVHQSLGGRTPEEHSAKPVPRRATLDSYGWQQHCRSLFQIPAMALSEPRLRDRLMHDDVDPVGSTPDELGKFMHSESAKSGKVINSLNLKVN